MSKKEPAASDKPLTSEWWKHLRPFLKRKASKIRRREGKERIEQERKDSA